MNLERMVFKKKMSEVILKVEKLNIFYKNNDAKFFSSKEEKRKQVVFDATFDIYEGQMLGLVGGSGCGKSSLGKAILGINKDIEGSIMHYSKMPQMIFQDPKGSLNPKMSVKQILEEPLKIAGISDKAELHNRVSEMLSDIGLSDEYMNRLPSALSGGQRQRVCIGQTLMLKPKLLIADEPVSALDVTVQAQIMKLFKEVNKKYGVAILFISHDLKVVYQLCDHIMIMDKGRIIEQGTDDEIIHSEFFKKSRI